jgi:hypothetical protein
LSVIARHSDAQAVAIGDDRFEEGAGADSLFVREDIGESDAGRVIDANMNIFPVNPTGIALPLSIASDAMTDLVEAAATFDVEMNETARLPPVRSSSAAINAESEHL